MKRKEIYLDYAATTPVDSALLREYAEISRRAWANPSSPHRVGQKARAILDDARERAAQALGAQFGEVVFTGSATEANNLAIRGVVDDAYAGKKNFTAGELPEIIISAIEHASVFETANALAEQKRITLLIAPVDSSGRVDPTWIGSRINPRTILISVMWVNNEIGTVQDITKISEVVTNFRKESRRSSMPHTPYPLFHTDAVQAFQYFSVDVSRVPVDLLTLAGHKMCAPKGVGLLYVRNGVPLTAQTAGGGQERGFRSGTESVPLAHALSRAMERAVKLRAKESVRLRTLHGAFVKLIKTRIKNARILSSAAHGSPHIISVLIDHIPADELLFLLDEAGIAASLGSACTTGKFEPSRVLSAIGISEDSVPLRLSMGRETRMSDIRAAASALARISTKLFKKSR